MKSTRLTDSQWNEIIEKYMAGSIEAHLCTEYQVDRQMFARRLDKAGVVRHSKEYVTRVGKGHTLREDAFSSINPASAYWAGFLCGDGNIDNNKISILLSEKDRGHLEKFKHFTGSSCVIQCVKPSGFSTGLGVKISIGSKRMTEELSNVFGIKPNKTFSTCAPEALQFNRDFWRGLVDADGSLAYYARRTLHVPYIQLVGSKNITEQFAAYMRSVCGTKVKPSARNKIYGVSTSCHMAEKVIENLYAGAETYLDRKKEKADAIIAAAKHN